jgi:hypothetical protein
MSTERIIVVGAGREFSPPAFAPVDDALEANKHMYSVRLERCSHHLPLWRQCLAAGQEQYVVHHHIRHHECRELPYTDRSAPDFMGGNSTKATSGINGAYTRSQQELGIKDSVKEFYDDTVKSARDLARPDLIKVLTYRSADAVHWLQDVFNLDLTLVSRMGYGLNTNLMYQARY